MNTRLVPAVALAASLLATVGAAERWTTPPAPGRPALAVMAGVLHFFGPSGGAGSHVTPA